MPVLVRCALALLIGAAVFQGWRVRTNATGEGGNAWASVLVVGSAGALIPALALHPWIPVAAYKYLWFTSPFVLCLGAAALPMKQEAP